MNERSKQPDDMRTFIIIWIGQLISTLGSGLTSFAMGVWIYEQTNSVVLFAVNAFVYLGMSMIVSPFAGAIVDRMNRRLILILSDTGAALSSLAIWLLLRGGNLEIWHVLVAAGFNAAFTSFQYPAHTAATTMLVPRRHLGRAGGMVQVGEAISGLAAPAAAGALYLAYGLDIILLIDFLTFLAAVAALLVVVIPEPVRQPTEKEDKPSIWQEIHIGWRFIADRKGLLYWMIYIAALNFSFGMISPLMTPLMLELGNPQQVGLSEAAFGLGMLAGTVIMSLWGGPKRRFYAVAGAAAWTGIWMIIMGLRPSLVLIGVSGFLLMLAIPILNANSRAMWQTKVPPDMQGRVFSVRRVIGQFTSPIAALLGAPLVEKLFQPWMESDGLLAGSLGQVIGTGPGRGIALVLLMVGTLVLLFSGIAGANGTLREAEIDIPDVEIEVAEG